MTRDRVDALVAGVRKQERASLARAITLVESERADDIDAAQELIHALLPDTGKSLRVGVSGVPGAGKSTFINALGSMLVQDGKRVAVLAVDPSSTVSGGSILGDKTRMGELSREDDAYIRPSPSSGTLGGVTRKTRETMLLCEAAGFDVVIVETVGVGQSEIVVSEMVDFYLVLMIAGAGDELQGIKRGILEVADMLIVNKADGDNVTRAKLARSSYETALHLMRGSGNEWDPPVLTCSAAEKTGLREAWAEVLRHHDTLEASGSIVRKRSEQRVRWMWSMIESGLMSAFRHAPEIAHSIHAWESQVRDGDVGATAIARQALTRFRSES